METVQQAKPTNSSLELPGWFKQPIPSQERLREMRSLLGGKNLHTVCQSAHCPNLGQCWERRTATFMILGDRCTRFCRFCAVESGGVQKTNEAEPSQVAAAVQKLGLRYVVITSVTRDDLLDGGAEQFFKTVKAIRRACPQSKVELLIPDFMNKSGALDRVAEAKADVVGHNIETVKRLFPVMRPQAEYAYSLGVLRRLKDKGKKAFVKSGFMVGLGESEEEIKQVMEDLRAVGCDMLTIGQYLSPSREARHFPVVRFVPREDFEKYKKLAMKIGFTYVMSGPLVRSSFHAEAGYQACQNYITERTTNEPQA